MSAKRTTTSSPLYEYRLDGDFNGMEVRYGTMDRECPDVVFLKAKIRFIANEKKGSYIPEVKSIKEHMERYAQRGITPPFEEHFIMDFAMPGKNIIFGRPSVMKFDLFLRPKERGTMESHEGDAIEIAEVFSKKAVSLITQAGFSVVS